MQSTARRPVIHVLSGCTASGKTELALRWAERQGAEIISCDSLLFYRGMDIGTAKPDATELARVPHHLVDLCEVSEPMDVGRYASLARACVESIHARGKAVLVTGGSGFYLKSFFDPVADELAVSPEIRARVAALDLAAQLGELRRLNPGGLGKLDICNPRRVSRALERCLASGRTLEALADDFARLPRPYADFDVRLTLIEREAEELVQRIELRVQRMLEGGLIEEVRRLLPLGLEQNPSAARAIGYREVIEWLPTGDPLPLLAKAICSNTRRLARKQRTWFRGQCPGARILPAAGATIDALFA